MLLADAIKLKKRDIVVTVGGGGKTTIIERLAQEQTAAGNQVIISTTTKIIAPGGRETGLVLSEYCNNIQQAAERSLNAHKLVYVGKSINKANKLIGLAEQEILELFKVKGLDLLLIEGDGSKGRPFKAPRYFEPVIPEIATVVIVVMGIDCVGKPLSEEYYHSIDQIEMITGLKRGEIVNEQMVAQIILHPQGYKKNVPPNAKWIPFINKVESLKDEIKALKVAELLKNEGVAKIIIGAANNKNCPVRLIK